MFLTPTIYARSHGENNSSGHGGPFQKWRCVCHIRKSQLNNAADDGNGGCENGDDVKKDQISYMRVP